MYEIALALLKAVAQSLDGLISWNIKHCSCGQLTIDGVEFPSKEPKMVLLALAKLEANGFVVREVSGYRITPSGAMFARSFKLPGDARDTES